MANLKDMSTKDLEYFIEQKLLEIVGDPDSDLQLTEDFKKKLQQRLDLSSKRIPHDEVLERFA